MTVPNPTTYAEIYEELVNKKQIENGPKLVRNSNSEGPGGAPAEGPGGEGRPHALGQRRRRRGARGGGGEAPAEVTMPRQTIQSPNRLYKAPTGYTKPQKDYTQT